MWKIMIQSNRPQITIITRRRKDISGMPDGWNKNKDRHTHTHTHTQTHTATHTQTHTQTHTHTHRHTHTHTLTLTIRNTYCISTVTMVATTRLIFTCTRTMTSLFTLIMIYVAYKCFTFTVTVTSNWFILKHTYFGFAVEVKVKMALSLIEYHPSEMYGLVKVKNHAFFVLARCCVNERPHARPL
jgi:ABC-type nickel/cobalt efflux system permease component RcnA